MVDLQLGRSASLLQLKHTLGTLLVAEGLGDERTLAKLCNLHHQRLKTNALRAGGGALRGDIHRNGSQQHFRKHHFAIYARKLHAHGGVFESAGDKIRRDRVNVTSNIRNQPSYAVCRTRHNEIGNGLLRKRGREGGRDKFDLKEKGCAKFFTQHHAKKD